MVNQRRKANGKGSLRIPGWTSWTAKHPEGLKDSEGREMKVGLTHQIASKGGEIDRSRSKPVAEDTDLTEDLSQRELNALDVMSERRGFDDEFWTEHRKRIASAEFSPQFLEWRQENGRPDEPVTTAWFRYLDESKAAERCGSVAVSLLKPGTKRYEKWLSLRNYRRKATMRKKQQEDQMAFSVTNLRTGETTTSEDIAQRQESRREFLAEAERKRGLRENAQEILFWSDQHRPQDYENCVLNVPTKKIDRVVEALQSGESLSQMRGWANCRICDENLGSSDLGGHGFVWPELAEHYIVEHGVWTPDLNKLADHLLSEDAEEEEIEEGHGAENKEAGKHCGVFIPLPYSLAKDFPDKSEHDTSVPHYTLLYMGDLTPKQYKVFCNLVQSFAQKLKPFECDTESYGEFLNAEGKKIPHMCPTARCATKMALLHSALRQHIENFAHEIGAKVEHSYGHMGGASSLVPYEIQFKAHATLGYTQPMAAYTGPKPMGAWRVTELECWGHERICCALGKTKIDQPTGLTREPLAGSYPRAVPDAFAEDMIPGGLADKASPREFDPKALAKGIKVELEHTSSAKIAQEIAMDHLTEDPRYYDKLEKMEKHEDVIGGSEGAAGGGLGGSTGDIGLAGSLPYQSVLQKAKNKLDRKKLVGLK